MKFTDHQIPQLNTAHRMMAFLCKRWCSKILLEHEVLKKIPKRLLLRCQAWSWSWHHQHLQAHRKSSLPAWNTLTLCCRATQTSPGVQPTVWLISIRSHACILQPFNDIDLSVVREYSSNDCLYKPSPWVTSQLFQQQSGCANLNSFCASDIFHCISKWPLKMTKKWYGYGSYFLIPSFHKRTQWLLIEHPPNALKTQIVHCFNYL